MSIRVAVTGVSGDVGLGAIRGLRPPNCLRDDIWLLGLDYTEYCPARYLVDSYVQMPRVDSPEYIKALLVQLRTHKIDILLPGIDSEIVILDRARELLSSCGAQVPLSPTDLVQAADDKLATFEYLRLRGINTPITCDADRPIDLGFPIVAKPRRGQASWGVVVLKDGAALAAFMAERRPGYCLQRYVDGPELTIGFLYDSDGALRDALAMERVLENGRTTRGTVVKSVEIDAFMRGFGSVVRGVGAVNVQLRVDSRKGPQVIEINARLSGSTAMRVALGFNDPLRLVRHFVNGVPIEPADVCDGTVYRLSTELVVPD